MANLSKIKRDKMIAFLEQLKEQHSDDESIRAFNEIENQLRDKKYGLVWEEHSEAVDEMLEENIPVFCADPERRLCKDPSLPWNFIIEGDNLQALYLLEKTHRGKVDCIYIDPPYNTGAHDWKYNNDYVGKEDAYRHSKWLSMMKNRLLLAKHILNPADSVLLITIDEKEYTHLGCLLEELFPDAKIQMITTMTNKKGQPRSGIFSRCEEYIFVVFIGSSSIQRTSENMLFDADTTSISSNPSKMPTIWNSLLRRGTHAARQDRPKLFYPIVIDGENKKIVSVGDPLELSKSRDEYFVEDGMEIAWPLHKDGSEGNWQMKPETLRDALRNGTAKIGRKDEKSGTWSIVYLKRKQAQQVKSGEILCDGRDENGALILHYPNDNASGLLQEPRSLWVKDSHDASVYGSTLTRKILPGRAFPFPKSLYAVQDTIRFFVANKPNAIIVDFFSGSGTTGHAVNLLNCSDNGKRTFIMVTNNEVSEDEAKKLEEKGYHSGDKEWENLGIAKYVTWPRTVCSIEGKNLNGQSLKGEYLSRDADGNPIPMSRGFNANVKYFKCEWTPRKPEDYLLSNALCLHICEMIELQNAIEIDNVRNVLLLNKEDFQNIIMNPEIYEQIENIWVHQNMILNSDELAMLRAKGFKYIPREFFGQELREAAE